MLALHPIPLTPLRLSLTPIRPALTHARPPQPDRAVLQTETLEHFRTLLWFDTREPPGRQLPAAEYPRDVLETATCSGRLVTVVLEQAAL